MPKGDSGVRCFQIVLIFGNVVIAMCGLALTAECIFFLSDQNGYYDLLDASYNDDIFAAAWIGLFVGFAFFLLSFMGLIGAMKSNKKLLLAYILLMVFVYCFEVASCITAVTHRDFFIPNLFLKQMLQRYQDPGGIDLDEQNKNKATTNVWNRLMLINHCCGVNGPQDWQNYTSTFRTLNSDAEFPWPRQCCVMKEEGLPINVAGCQLGAPGFLYTTGCYEMIAGPLNRHAWGVAWFGFAILCWTFVVLVLSMYYYTRID